MESLSIGQKVRTASGELRPIKWIGRRSYNGRFILGRSDILPICFKMGSLGENVPKRDLWVSPHHAMYFAQGGDRGLLIEAKDLVNGLTIVQASAVERVEYFHIELDTHDVIVAEGALSESFVDDDSRGMFNNADDFARRYPSDGAQLVCYYAPRLDSGYEVEAVRRQLGERAGISLGNQDATQFRGFVDRASETSIEGWIQNIDHPEAPVCVDIVVDGRLIGQALANNYRDDLKDAGIGSGHHAFRFKLPGELAPTSSIEVRRSLDGAMLGRSRQAA